MTLIAQIAQLRHGGSHKLVGDLAKNKLIARVQHAKCKGESCISCASSMITDTCPDR